MLSQEYFVFKQHSFGVYCVNLTPKYLPFLCLCYQNLCALSLTGRICNRDVIVVCILPRIYIFLELETMSFTKLEPICTAMILPWFLLFSQKFAVFFTIFCHDFLLSLCIAKCHQQMIPTQPKNSSSETGQRKSVGGQLHSHSVQLRSDRNYNHSYNSCQAMCVHQKIEILPEVKFFK